jgi:hypothetical protein
MVAAALPVAVLLLAIERVWTVLPLLETLYYAMGAWLERPVLRSS